MLSYNKEYRYLKKVIYQTNIKNEWLLLSTSFRANLSWFLENAFS